MNDQSSRGPSLSSPDEHFERLRQYVALWDDDAGKTDEGAAMDGDAVDAMLASSPPDAIDPADEAIDPADEAMDPSSDDAFAAREAELVAAEGWEPLVELYLARLETRTEPYERADLLRRIAQVFEHGLDDREQALDALVSALHDDVHDRTTARELERLAHATKRWSEVIGAVAEWLRVEVDPSLQVRLCLHLAKWYGDDLGRPELAQPYYGRILQLDPNNVDALRQLASLYAKAGNWEKAGTTLERALAVAVIDADRKEILTDIGALLDAQMGDTDRALVFFKQATVVDPQFLPALAHLARIFAARGEHKELAEVRERQIAGTRDPAQAAAVKLEAAALYESQLGDHARAAKLYREVTDVEPANAHALRGLARAYEALGEWTELVRTLEALLDVVTTGKARIELLVALANVYEEHFLKSDLAAVRLEQVLEIDPNDMGAYFELERNYRKRRQWPELVSTYERHIAATFERKGKLHLYAEIAKLYEEELGDVAAAIDAYRTIVTLDDANVPALEALAKLHDRAGDVPQSIRFMTRVAMLAPEAERADALYRSGKALEEKVADKHAARERYEQALDVDPAHLPTLAALRQIAIDEGDFEKAVRLLDVEQSHATAPRHRAKLLVELAKLREEALGDHESAVLVWEAALEADPESLDSALPLAEEYVRTAQWERAEPLLDRLVRKASAQGGDRAEQHALLAKLGRVATELGKHDKAAKTYRAACELDPTDREAVTGLAEASFASGDFATAQTTFAKALSMLGEVDRAARANALYKLGCIKRELGKAKMAAADFERALAVDRAHRPTLDALVALYAAVDDRKSVAAYKRAILDALTDDDERYAMLLEIADVWTAAAEPARAAEALEEAREIRASSALLHRLLALYQATRSWTQTVATLRAIATLEKDAARRAKLVATMAQIHKDELGDDEGALALYDEALDACPTHLDAFERINKVLTAKKDWKGLERAFRKMLRRLSVAGVSDADLEHMLWHNLGLIYRDRLRDAPSAIEAFKMATRYKPDDPLERQILAELYEATNDTEGAASEHTLVLRKDPMRVDPYRSLCQLYLREKSYDRAWCACAALAVLGKADAEEQRFFDQYRPRGVPQMQSRLVNEHWLNLLVHKDCDLYIGKILEMITPAAIVAKTAELRQKGAMPVLPARAKHDPATSPLPLARTFGWAAQVLGLPSPELYVREDVLGMFVAVPSVPPATIAGRMALVGLTEQQVAFLIGKHLTGYRGDTYIRNLFPTLAELKVLFSAAVKIVMPDFAVPPDLVGPVVAAARELDRHMQPIQREGLRLVVQRYVADGAKADLRRWMQTTELTAARAGLLLAGDLEVARRIVATEPQFPGDLSPQEKVKELVVFSVSDEYARLRSALGIGVVVAA